MKVYIETYEIFPVFMVSTKERRGIQPVEINEEKVKRRQKIQRLHKKLQNELHVIVGDVL